VSTREKIEPVSGLEAYLERPYHYELIRDSDDDGRRGWVAEVEELPGCMSQGATAGEAIENVRDAMYGWISAALDNGQTIPVPRRESQPSGRFLVRLPRTLHGELSRVAEDEGISLNQFVVGVLAAAVGWRVRDRART
jgi:antitoxin HicB